MTIHDEIRAAVEAAIPGSRVEAGGTEGHYRLTVTAAAFEGKRTLDRQRLVMKALGPLMSGEDAPVHAIDRLECRTG